MRNTFKWNKIMENIEKQSKKFRFEGIRNREPVRFLSKAQDDLGSGKAKNRFFHQASCCQHELFNILFLNQIY